MTCASMVHLHTYETGKYQSMLELAWSLTSALTFVVAAVAWACRSKEKERERLIRSTPPALRDDLIRQQLEFFHVDASGLGPIQMYELVLDQIRHRAQRFQAVALGASTLTLFLVAALTSQLAQVVPKTIKYVVIRTYFVTDRNYTGSTKPDEMFGSDRSRSNLSPTTTFVLARYGQAFYAHPPQNVRDRGGVDVTRVPDPRQHVCHPDF